MPGSSLTSAARPLTLGVLLLALLLVALPQAAVAQQTGQITGTVSDSSSGAPIPGAQVIVAGTTLGTVSGNDGRFTVARVPVGTHTVQVRRVGFNQREVTGVAVAAGATVTLDVRLRSTPLQLEAVITTGVVDPTAGTRVPFTVGRVDAANVGILVPGTFAEMATMQGYSAEAADVALTNPGTTATISWLGTDMPSSLVSEASRRSFSQASGTHLLNFVEGLGLKSERNVSLVGHSAGGAAVGYADYLGVDVDRVLHVASAGTGLGLGRGLDYRDTTWDGDARPVVRYTQTAPNDPIAVSTDTGWLTDGGPLGHGWGHEDTFTDWVVLDTGRVHGGEQIAGGPRRTTRLSTLGRQRGTTSLASSRAAR